MEQLFGGFQALPSAFAQGMYLGERQRAAQAMEAERAAERERAARTRQEEFMMRFGDDAVVGPDGNIDILKSTQRRALSDEAERVGRLEGFMQSSMADVNPELRSLPAFRRGMASGMAERQLQDFNLDRQLAIEAARERAKLGVQELRGEQSEAAQAARGWENAVRALNRDASYRSGRTVKVQTGGERGEPRVEMVIPEEDFGAWKAQQQIDKAVADIDRRLADYEDAESQVKLSSAGDFVLSFDADKRPTIKEGGLSVLGDEPRKDVLERIEAEKNALLAKRSALTRRPAERAAQPAASDAAARFLEGVNPDVSVKPTAAPSVGRVPMGDRQPDAVVRGAVNPQRQGAGLEYFYDTKTGRVVLMQPRKQ